ncbi:flagellar hook protein FlgE [Rhizobium sp. DKSPLA3]|uniref:Flagellar hook protein FlgE n=1 Tax=Rhizobium quercicola TaxID=2901226 RepID=A0A9X1NRS6_9HYPH|nr:flagellar hook protein FlgE [Rhizobium quercicola]MCD7108514.1 flagellar hook protein FlgE [Rhizobium quercicola]
MSLNGTMRTGVSGMNAQANRLSTVADNIANASTTGYKKASTEFSSMILATTGGTYNSGGITTDVRHAISAQGTFTDTTSVTDLAIDGKGFFVVTGTDGLEYLTRAGAFTPVDDGTLRNAAGFTLMGYEYSSTKDPTIVVNGFSGLSQITLAEQALTATGSTSGVLDANLPSNADVGYEKATSLVAYDSQGNTRKIEFQYEKTDDNAWRLQVSEGSFSLTKFTTTSDAVVHGSLDGAPSPLAVPDWTVDEQGIGRQVNYTYTRISPTSWALDVIDTSTSGVIASRVLDFDSTGNLTTDPILQTTASTFAGATLPSIRIDLSQIRNSPGPHIPVTSSNGNETGSPINLLFDTNGRLIGPASVQTVATVSGGTVLEGLAIDISGSTQLASDFTVSNGKIDGTSASKAASYEISDDGVLSVKYDNGKLTPKYRIAMASVQSPDHLEPLSGNVYAQSSNSGAVVMGYAGSNGYGSIISGSLENSNVDIAEELTSMIESQRSYTANSKVFQTGSELLETLVNLKR